MNYSRTLSVILFAGHLLLGLAFKEIAGVSITANPNGLTHWDAYWQNLPVIDLRERLVESLWNLHAQPPLHNLYGALFFHLFPDQPLHAMQVANSVLGALICAMSAMILWRITHNRWATLIGGVFIALNPGLFLFEAYMLYTIPSVFLIVVCAWCIALSREQPAFLYGFVLSGNLLVLTRSLYHPIFLPVIVLLATIFAGARWKRALALALVISLLGLGWATKNAIQFNFWGTSSWGGLNMWRVAAWNYTPPELEAFAEEGLIDPLVVELGPFTYPSSYVPYGFDRESDIPSLARDNYHNINIPAIAQVYQRSALALIRHDPGVYVSQVIANYSVYTCPASAFRHNELNRERMPALVRFYEDGLYGTQLFQSLNLSILGCSIQYFVIPLSLLASGVVWGWWAVRRMGLFEALCQERVMVTLAVFVVYNTLAGTLFEVEENARFKFMIEPLLWIFVVSLSCRLVVWLVAHSRLRRAAPKAIPEPVIAPPVSALPPPVRNLPARDPLAYVLGGALMLVGVVMLVWQFRGRRRD